MLTGMCSCTRCLLLVLALRNHSHTLKSPRLCLGVMMDRCVSVFPQAEIDGMTLYNTKDVGVNVFVLPYAALVVCWPFDTIPFRCCGCISNGYMWSSCAFYLLVCILAL
ncbi:unnamed protein product [Ectocarpus sp. 4 AP-2014]